MTTEVVSVFSSPIFLNLFSKFRLRSCMTSRGPFFAAGSSALGSSVATARGAREARSRPCRASTRITLLAVDIDADALPTVFLDIIAVRAAKTLSSSAGDEMGAAARFRRARRTKGKIGSTLSLLARSNHFGRRTSFPPRSRFGKGFPKREYFIHFGLTEKLQSAKSPLYFTFVAMTW